MTDSLKTEKRAAIVLFLIMAGLSLWGRMALPDVPMAVHFDAMGVANGFMPRDPALLLMPGVGLGLLVVLLWIIPAVMPKSAPVERSAAAFGACTLAVLLLLTVIHGALVLSAAGVIMDHLRIIHGGAGLLLIVIGNYLPKMRRNYIMGLRTPWTLADERVWDRTHRLGGPVFMMAGLAIVLAAILLPVTWQVGVLLTAVLGAAGWSFVYSYGVAKGLKQI